MTTAGIVSTACAFPEGERTLAEVCADEGVELGPQELGRIGVETVRTGDIEHWSDLALRACSEALTRGGVGPEDVDVIIDYSIMPQQYLVPAWNPANRLQHELGAVKAFTLGFSGGGASNLLVALSVATSLIRSDGGVSTALLFGTDLAIQGNRIVNRDQPVTILGDGASAMVVSAGAAFSSILGTALWSDGAYHDVSLVPAGALANRGNGKRYRLEIDVGRYRRAPKGAILSRLTDLLLQRVSVAGGDLSHVLFPNVAAADQAVYLETFGPVASPVCAGNRARYGHLHANDLVANLESLTSDGGAGAGDLILVTSHGMGFLAGATLLRR